MSGTGPTASAEHAEAPGPHSRGATSQPRSVSVVVPTHDTRELTLRCLSALVAAGPVAELVVVDDGSDDGTADAVAASYPGVRLLRHATARGFTAAANAGAELTSGDLLLLLNSDTEVAPDALEALLAAFAANHRLGVAGAALAYPDGTPQWSGGGAPSAPWLVALASGLAFRLGESRLWRRLRPVSGHRSGRVDWVPAAAMAVRRAVWESAGPFDSRFALYAQDLDMCLRAGALGWEVAVVGGCRVVHHHGATVSSGAGVAAARHNRELLWADLVRWAAKGRGLAGGRAAARLLRAGGERRRHAALERQSLGRAAAAANAAVAEARAAAGLPAAGERSTTR